MKKHLKTARIVAKLLDNKFSLFGIKFGLDPIMDIVPGLGDFVGAIFSLYLIWVAIKLDLPEIKILLMLRNIVIDFILGIVPIAGPIFDLFYKSNLANLKILEDFDRTIIEGEIIG